MRLHLQNMIGQAFARGWTIDDGPCKIWWTCSAHEKDAASMQAHKGELKGSAVEVEDMVLSPGDTF